MTTIVAPPSNASKWQMGFNSAFKGINRDARPTKQNIPSCSHECDNMRQRQAFRTG